MLVMKITLEVQKRQNAGKTKFTVSQGIECAIMGYE
jgi:hypothetical protein